MNVEELKQDILKQFLNARNQDFQSELGIYTQTPRLISELEKAGASDSELSGIKKFMKKLEKKLKKRYNVTEAELNEALSEEIGEGEE